MHCGVRVEDGRAKVLESVAFNGATAMGCPQVCGTATLQCSFGAAPAVLNVLPVNRLLTGGMPAANIMDHIPLVNITTDRKSVV